MSCTINASTTSGLVNSADTSGSLQFQTNSGTAAMTIDTSQNVGIGTTSPGSYGKLSVIGGSIYTDTALYSNDGTTTSRVVSSGGVSYWGTTTNQPVVYQTNNIERMRIDTSGNVLVGKTTQASLTTAGFNIWGNSSANNGAIQAVTSGNWAAYFARLTNTGVIIYFQYAGADIGNISTNGTATAYNTSSDYRLKENIVPMTGALAIVQALKPVTYKWKIDGSDGQGFIAHELQEVIPEAVTGTKDAVNEDGSIKPQGVDTSFLVATLTAAIQEQQTIINDLKARITALESATSQAPVANTGGTV